MLSASISAISACACLPWQDCRLALKLRLNSSHPEGKKLFESLELFAIVLYIFTGSSFWRTRIKAQVVEQKYTQYRPASFSNKYPSA